MKKKFVFSLLISIVFIDCMAFTRQQELARDAVNEYYRRLQGYANNPSNYALRSRVLEMFIPECNFVYNDLYEIEKGLIAHNQEADLEAYMGTILGIWSRHNLKLKISGIIDDNTFIEQDDDHDIKKEQKTVVWVTAHKTIMYSGQKKECDETFKVKDGKIETIRTPAASTAAIDALRFYNNGDYEKAYYGFIQQINKGNFDDDTYFYLGLMFMQGKRICKKLYPNSDLRDKICSFYWMKSFRGRMALHYYGMDTYYHLDYKKLKYPFVCGLMTVYKGNGEAYGYMNENGKMVIPYKYKSAFSFSEKSHMALVNIHDSKWGLIKTDGTCSMFLKLDMVSLFADEVYSVALSNKWGLIDSFGKEILVPQYQYIGTLNDGLAIYKDDDKYGFLNKYGNVAIKAQYEKVFDFICGYAPFQKDGKFGYINHDNKIVVPPIYESCTNFTRIMRIAAVKKKGYWGLVDTEGNELTGFCYNKIEMYDKEKYVIAYIGKKRYTIYFDDMKKHIL